MVISIASQKGGTGKTSTSISLAAGLARKGKRVLLIDVDSQANSSKVLLHHYPRLTKDQTLYATILDRAPLLAHPTQVPNLSLVPSHILLSNTDIELTTAKDHRESRLKAELDKLKDSYDYVFLDNPPALGWLTLNSFTASDKVLVVVSPGYFELDSLVQLGKTLEEVREYFNPHLELLGYLFTMSEPTINSATSLQILRQTYTQRVLRTVIPRNTDLRDAHFNKTDIFAFNPHAKAALAYAKLIRELFLEEAEPEPGEGLDKTMRKQLDVTTITNELRGNSAFFPRRRPEAADGQVDHISEPSPSAVPPTPQPVPPVRAIHPVPLVRDVPPVKRVMKQRWPVDIYQDQYESLQQLALEERKQGGIGSMSAMVRQALDKLIAEKRNAKK